MELKNNFIKFLRSCSTGECKIQRPSESRCGFGYTANTVLAVVDTTNRPIAGISAPSNIRTA